MPKTASIEELEAFWEALQGPSGDLLRATGAIMARRIRERRADWSDLSDNHVLDLFLAAFLQAAPATYPTLSAAKVEEAVRIAFADMAMKRAANVEAGDSRH